MRWGQGREKRTVWTDRLGAVGAALDGRGIELRAVAVSVTGAETWITALSWYSGGRHGWKPVAFPFDPSASSHDGEWAMRLRAAGELLDLDSRPLRNPCLVDLTEGWLITATVANGSAQVWETATWRTVHARRAEFKR